MKKLKRLALALSMTAILSSCGQGGGSASEEFKPSLDKNTKCTLKVVGDYSNFKALENEFDKFKDYYPNVTLTYTKIDAYTDNIATVLDGDDAPNIFFTYASWMSGDAKYSSVISHMEDLSDSKLKINLDCIRPGLLNHASDNKVYMVPVFSRTFGALVNENLFKQENIAIPTKWSELLSACQTFKSKGIKSPMMGYSLKDSNSLMYTLAYPSFVSSLAKNPEAIAKANNLDPAAGEYMRNGLTKIKQLVDDGAINLTECDAIADNYNAVIQRFFVGDVPMMVCHGDTASGTKSREPNPKPFDYSFVPIPLSEEGGYFIDSPSIQFSVNKTCQNLEMTNEFMSFLVRTSELNAMSVEKRLVTPAKQMNFDSIYAPFAKVSADKTFAPEALGVKDPISKQTRIAAFKVGKGELTVDQAVAQYGSF